MCYYTSEVSCPYFYPVAPRFPANPQTAMLPLGDLWDGTCHAAADHPCAPDEAVLRPVCHLGYARSQCQRFAGDDPGPDAVRFCLSADTGALLRLSCVLERDHHPFAYTTLEYSRAAGCFGVDPPSPILRRQAEAYVESYLRRKAAMAR